MLTGCPLPRPFEEAFRAFSTIGPNGTTAQQQGSTLLAVRCGLLFGNTMAALGNYKDAANCHARTATFCDPVLSAMLLEQVAICNASKSPSHVRAALRCMMLAGNRYYSWRLPALAAVCYKAVAEHQGSGWPEVTRALAEHASAACQAKARWRDAALYFGQALREVDVGETGADVVAQHLKLLRGLRWMLDRSSEVGQDLSADQLIMSLNLPRISPSGYLVELRGLQVRRLACRHIAERL
jgi:hypothetical protein